MTQDNARNTTGISPPAGIPRLLPPSPCTDLMSHLRSFGPLPPAFRHVIDHVNASGLLGRGGAGFPTGTKMAAVEARGRRPVIVANGTEGEPASAKDRTLMMFAPHLVLDGISTAASALDASDAIICIDSAHGQVATTIAAALAERVVAGIDRVPIRIELTPHRYVAGEETALVHWLNGGDAKPTTTPPRPFEKGVRGRPTLVDNVETLANVALIARFGSEWFRTVGQPAEPGTVLLTVSGRVGSPGVIEVPSGSTFSELLHRVDTEIGNIDAVLIGGYFGTWVPSALLSELTVSHSSLRSAGGSLGSGVVFVLAKGACGLQQSARVIRWMADQNAGQCGPCMFGLPAIADAFELIVAGGRRGRDAYSRVQQLLPVVERRGACRHPDGAVRFTRSALSTFAGDIDRHLKGRSCAPEPAMLPTPITGGWR